MSQNSNSIYGTRGLNVGIIGRWSQLLWRILILVPLDAVKKAIVDRGTEIDQARLLETREIVRKHAAIVWQWHK